ncbi:hypothetical protein ACTU3I_03265 [Microbacterium sp. RD1]|uniref:hypothetical protein n=1 Tax=Microbacterium sp. RD1 TaxID=3457313 RepID=UPI003FA534E5
MIPDDWTPHRRPEDREVLGWIRPAGDAWVAVSLLGRDLTGPVEWLEAEAALEERGLGYLAGIWMLDGVAAEPLRVRLVEVTPARVVVHTDDFGAIDVPVDRYELPWPAPAALRPPHPDDAAPAPWG